MKWKERSKNLLRTTFESEPQFRTAYYAYSFTSAIQTMNLILVYLHHLSETVFLDSDNIFVDGVVFNMKVHRIKPLHNFRANRYEKYHGTINFNNASIY